jgi:hypothetical protein
MRNLIFVVAAIAVLAVGTAASAAMFRDVPPDHWAYEAIDYLQQQGIVEGYPDGTFKGNRTFTRYEMSMVIARIYSKFEDYVKSQPQADWEGINARLDRLANEFKDELASMGVRLDQVEGQVNKNTDDIRKLKAMIKDTNINGFYRIRTGAYVNTGVVDWSNDFGHEQYLQLNLNFMPEENIKFDFSLTSAETQGAVGTAFIPGANNEFVGPPGGTPPFGATQNASSFVLDVAKATIDLTPYTSSFGDDPTFTVGRQYFSEGEFGLAGDNGWRSNFGYRFDTSWHDGIWAFYVGAYRVEAPFTAVVPGVTQPFNPFTYSFGSSVVNRIDNDDYVNAGFKYRGREGVVPGHDHHLEVNLDGSPNGYGSEQFIGLSGNAEIPWFDDEWFNGIRAEWMWTANNASDFNAEDLGLEDMSLIVELDVYNDGTTKFAVAGASIPQMEGLPVFANVDNDPFSEWDFTVNGVGDAFNISREGKNYFPSDYEGIGATFEHTFNNDLYGKVTWYTGERINAFFDARPDLLKFNFRYPFAKNASLGLDVISAGQYDGLTDAITLVRGEFLLHF